MKRSFILGLHMVLKDISPLLNSLMIGRILLDPEVKLLLYEQPSLDLMNILSLDEAGELLSRETHGPTEADSLMSVGEPQRMIVLETCNFFGEPRVSRECCRVWFILLLARAGANGI